MTDISPATYKASFVATSMSAAQDVFSILCPTGKRIAIKDIRIGQYSDFGDAQAENIGVNIYRGNTVGSGGSAITPANVKSWGPSSGATVRKNDTTPGSGGTLMHADVWNVAAGFWEYPQKSERLWLDAGERLSIQITAPSDAVTGQGSVTYEEMNT